MHDSWSRLNLRKTIILCQQEDWMAHCNLTRKLEEFFHFGSNLKITLLHYPPKERIFRELFGTFVWRSEPKWKTFWEWATFCNRQICEMTESRTALCDFTRKGAEGRGTSLQKKKKKSLTCWIQNCTLLIWLEKD